ncbi:multidrug resistance-associated protein 1 isoform X4 [Chrysoperla carnea]|uniref:multidrug resistance-associated protein 1 isoform X4 n=1 Tax=Chrysoperla carnea TaxID=189513 RepID=UPI001D075AF4|nr:multidrug resistance-associated protein 1 isoform X4 [Chrysoperla carnea]
MENENSHPLDSFCGSQFWNETLTWNTTNPDLTECFQKTVLIWVPNAFLWICSVFDIYYMCTSKTKYIPWNFLNLLKSLLILVLIGLNFFEIALIVFNGLDYGAPNDIFAPTCRLFTYLLALCLLYFNKVRGLRTSGLLFLYWFLLAIFGIVQFRSEIQNIKTDKDFITISYLIQYPVILIILLLNCWADKEPKFSEYAKDEKPCPEIKSSFLSKILYAWFDPLAWKGFRKPLETKDLWSMKPEDQAQTVVPAFDYYWQRTLRKNQKIPSNAKFRTGSNNVDISPSQNKKIASILPALCKAFGPTFVLGSLLKLIQDVLTFASPQLLKVLIKFIEDPSEPLWKGYFFSILMLLTAMLQTLILSQYFHRMFIVGLRIRTALISAIFRKALVMSNKSRKDTTVGEIVNLMAVDAQRFMDLTAYLNLLWSAPLQIILCLYFLWGILGPSVLAGLAVMIILIPVNGFIANKVKTLQIKQMKNKDERVKLMNEVLSGIKVLKLYAWEPSFEQQVLKIRNKEVKVLKEAAYLNAGTSFIWSCAPFLVSLVTFATFVLVDENNILDSKTAFVSLSLFNILRFPLSMLPMMISNIVQAGVSVKRINKFMNADELDPENVSHDPKESCPLIIENGYFSWGEENILENINLKLEKNSLNAVVGSVGAGKSSLVSAFLGEMDKVSGRVNTIGSIAYVSQQAWIQNATLRDNILFGKPFVQSVYDKVVDACALVPDIKMLPGGDSTEIGEKGINLSGGQKQRVNLARAVYNDADVYFFDDPLSAVDSHVGKHIFEKVIGPTGMLKHKTRVLVTHGITYLPHCDQIIVLKDGRISEIGTYQFLLDKKGAFSEFLIQHLQEIQESENSEELDEIKNTLGSTVAAELVQRQRSRISESVSESGSIEKQNGSLKRQRSVDSGSGEKSIVSLRKSSQKKDFVPVIGEKLIETEKAETGSVKWKVYSHYLLSIGLFLCISTIFMNMVFQAFSIGSNFWLSVWSDDEEHSQERKGLYLGVYGALGVGQVCAVITAVICLAIGALGASEKMHNHLLGIVLRNPMSFFDTTPVGRVLVRFSHDVDVMDTTMPQVLRQWLFTVFRVVATLFVISYSTPIFMTVIIPIGLFYYFVQRFYVATSRQLKRLESVSRSPIYSHFGESVSGTHIIRAYGVQNRFISESEHRVDLNQVCYYPSIVANRWLAVRLEMVGNLIIFFAALFAVLNRDTVNSGTVGLSISYALQITQTLNWLVRMTSDVETNIVAVERIKEYGETQQEAAWEIAETNPPASWPQKGEVEFKDYSVRYRPGLEFVLKNLSFTVKGGEKVGIVGRTGAGKSTLTLSLFRILEASEGSIIIDNVNISVLGLHALRSRLTIIPQDPVLFSGTLRLNLDPFDKYSDADLWRALEHAHLKTFCEGLTAGLNHEVSEGGENLSVGQRQLICLARALLRKTKVLILDEATAAVDLETDDLIQRTIRTEFADCTVLTIAHRLNTIMDSDRVLVLDKGGIVEYDSPQVLLQSKTTIFYGMAKDANLV